MKIAPGGLRQHRGAQARRAEPRPPCGWPDNRRSGAARGVLNVVTGFGATAGRGDGLASGPQTRSPFHRLDRGGQAHPAGGRGQHGRRSRSKMGGKSPTYLSRREPTRRWRRRWHIDSPKMGQICSAGRRRSCTRDALQAQRPRRARWPSSPDHYKGLALRCGHQPVAESRPGRWSVCCLRRRRQAGGDQVEPGGAEWRHRGIFRAADDLYAESPKDMTIAARIGSSERFAVPITLQGRGRRRRQGTPPNKAAPGPPRCGTRDVSRAHRVARDSRPAACGSTPTPKPIPSVHGSATSSRLRPRERR